MMSTASCVVAACWTDACCCIESRSCWGDPDCECDDDLLEAEGCLSEGCASRSGDEGRSMMVTSALCASELVGGVLILIRVASF